MVVNEAVQVIYKGVANPITVHVDHYKPAELTVKVSEGSITKNNDSGSYNWTICASKNKFVEIKIYCGKQFIKSIKFPLKPLPEPVCMIGSSDGGFFCPGPSHHKQSEGIRADWRDFTFKEVIPTVESFRFTIRKVHYTGNNDTTIIVFNKGANFNDTTKKLISLSRPGDTIIFDEILVQIGCEATVREIKKVEFELY